MLIIEDKVMQSEWLFLSLLRSQFDWSEAKFRNHNVVSGYVSNFTEFTDLNKKNC